MNTNESVRQMTGRHAAEAFAAALTAKFADSDWPYNPEFTADPRGKKYIRIVNEGAVYPGDQTAGLARRQRSVHAFVDAETGEVYMSGGWTGPAKGVRFPNIWEALVKADRHGSYLYMR